MGVTTLLTVVMMGLLLLSSLSLVRDFLRWMKSGGGRARQGASFVTHGESQVTYGLQGLFILALAARGTAELTSGFAIWWGGYGFWGGLALAVVAALLALSLAGLAVTRRSPADSSPKRTPEVQSRANTLSVLLFVVFLCARLVYEMAHMLAQSQTPEPVFRFLAESPTFQVMLLFLLATLIGNAVVGRGKR